MITTDKLDEVLSELRGEVSPENTNLSHSIIEAAAASVFFHECLEAINKLAKDDQQALRLAFSSGFHVGYLYAKKEQLS